MALKKAAQLGGDFLDLKELAGDGSALVVFRVVEFLAPETASGFVGTNVPVLADVLICSGPRAGEVHLSERFIGAITATLRGVKNPNTAKGIGVLEPVETVGSEIAARIKVVNPGKSNAGAVGDPPSDPEMAAIEAVHAGGAGWNVAPAGSVPAQANGQLVGAGAPTRPF